MNDENIAQFCHNVNKVYCECLGDSTQVEWNIAPQWQKDSAIKGVEFHIANPKASDSASHESWLEQKRQDGWQYGTVKDVEKKLHPCFVPFECLPVEQQIKDALFRSNVNILKRLLKV